MLLLQVKDPKYNEPKPWAIIPMFLISGLLLFLYWKLYQFSSKWMKAFIARKERQYNITVAYNRFSIVLRGKISGYDSVKLHLQLFLGYFIAYFLPLVVTGVIAIALPDSWFAIFFKK